MDEALRSFLADLGRSLAAAGPRAEPERSLLELPPRVGPAPGEEVELFLQRWRALGGHGHVASTAADVWETLRWIFREQEVTSAIRWQDEVLDRLFGAPSQGLDRVGCSVEVVDAEMPRHMRLATIARKDAGIVSADFAIAETGTVVHRSGRARPKSVSLLPRVLIAVVPKERVVAFATPVLAAMAAWLDAPCEEDCQGVQWITGPSRSSDIENDLTIGVHGPGAVYALVVEPPALAPYGAEA